MKIARIPVADLPRGLPGFVRWLRTAHPNIHRAVGARLAASNQLNGLGLVLPGTDPVAAAADNAAQNPGVTQTILNTVKELVSVGLPLYQQNKLFELQIKRAQQNLPPLDTQAISDASALRVGVDSGTRNTGLIIAGVGAAALLGYALLRR